MKEHSIFAFLTVVAAVAVTLAGSSNSSISNRSGQDSLLASLLVKQNLSAPPATPASPSTVRRNDSPYIITDRGIYISGPPVNETGNTVLTVGYLTAIKGELKEKQGLAISGAITLALDEINNNPNILPNVTLALRWNDTKGDTVLATRAMTEMICDGVATFFGPEGNCHVEGIVSQSRNIPMISYKCSDYVASPIPTFARTEPPDTQVTKSIISLLKYYSWWKFSVLYLKDWENVAESLKIQADKLNMTLNHKLEVHDNHKCCERDMECCRTGYWYQQVRDTMEQTRIYVFLGHITTFRELMDAMDSLKMFQSGEYMVIFVDMMTYSPREALHYIWTPDQVTNYRHCNELSKYKQRAQSLLVIVSTPPTQDYEKFTVKVREYNSREPFNFTTPFVLNMFQKFVSIYAAYLYDSVMLYAMALDKLLRIEQKVQPLTEEVIRNVAANGTRIVETIIMNKTYQSITGATIKIDQFGDSEGNFSVLSLKSQPLAESAFECDYHMVPVATFVQGDDFPELKIINASSTIDWPGGERPYDMPSCGYLNELCPRRDTHVMSLIVAGILGLILFCAAVIVMSIYRKWKIELEIEGLLWKIEPHEIFGYFGNDIVASPSKLSLASAASYGSKYSNQVFTPTAKYRGVMVRIKELRFSKKKDISREIMKEMRNLRELRHDNLNSFIGACVEPIRILLVTDYCAKGSLYDIVENEDIKLEDLFIASLVHDLIKAMLYIHNSYLEFHGNLKSSNCVVTSRWVLQVTDFGLHDLRQCAENESIGEHQHYRNLLWRAPELLRNPNVYGSKAGDVYAFSIILYEIIGRKGPFGPTGAEPKEIIDLVRHVPDANEVPFRPDLECLSDTGNCPDYVMSCIQDCWAENPDMRPDFPTIRNRLKKMRGGKSKNIMDQMMEMMEKYTNNLEDIVNDRTRLLCEEKRKTEDLLHRMLPQSVAEKLTSGHGVEPVSYDSVTIYFSDIVGFTAMSAESTPLQVVNFLNDLYTVFDQIIKGYNVYKVETIGDAYMVVSGLPIKNGDRHVGEVASMALDLLEAVKSHKISHRPNETLKLRIGMHTGPVVAGVVGLTMPRYCLFGDTVNTASRMESNGEALKIHVSPNCKAAMDKLGGYITEIRGPIFLKGKGEVTTYWLTGATEAAIQRRPVSLDDLPPPLFCRPRKSPKTESRQPSLIAGSCFGIPNLNAGRRHSQIPRNDAESTYSLQGAIIGNPSGSPRTLHRMPSKLDRTPLYLNHGSRSTLVEAGAGDPQQQMEMGTLVRKKHSVSMDGDDEEEQETVNDEQPTSSLLGPKKIPITIRPPVPGVGVAPLATGEDCNNFQVFNKKRASFDPSNLLMLRESRSLDRFPSSVKNRLSFKRLTSKLTFSSKGDPAPSSHPPPVSVNSVSEKGDRWNGGGGANKSNGGLVGQQQQQQQQTSDYIPAPKSSSDSNSFIDNSILRFSDDGLLLPPTTMMAKKPQQSTQLPQPASVGKRPQATHGNGKDHTVINCNGFDGYDPADQQGPLMVVADASTTTNLPEMQTLRPAIKPERTQRRNDSVCLGGSGRRNGSETEAEEEDRFDKKWRSMDTLKDKREKHSGGGGGAANKKAAGRDKVYANEYYFDHRDQGSSGQDSASDDNRSGPEENNRRTINFVDDVTSAEESSDTGGGGGGNRDPDSASMSSMSKGKWYKNIFNNGNGNASTGSVHGVGRGGPGSQKPDNLLLNNNNNNSNRNKNHKRFNLSSKVNPLEAIKQSPESKEDEGEETLFLNSSQQDLNDQKPQGSVEELHQLPPPPTVIVDSPTVSPPPTLIQSQQQALEQSRSPSDVLVKLKLNASPFVETSANSLECGEHVA